ncbi:MAG: DUF3160 domain-containing protein [Bacteroidaceae bacterium]|nr:DUF3160 domain-containing protein [Bacteroidaceae bacterium]
MKKLLAFLMLVTFTFTACNQRSGNPDQPSLQNIYNPQSLLLTDDELPQSIDFNMDISQLSYQELRILRYYPYALHGIWIKEGDINGFFCSRTKWYYNLADSLYWGNDENNYESLINFDDFDENYDKYLSQVQLTDEEKAFIAKIDARMADLAKNKQITSPQGIQLQNPAVAVNLHQISNPSEQLLTMLLQNNMAMEHTDYEQLFQVYESNDYSCIPSFITTDLMLQAYHMYFEYVLKYLEQFNFIPSLAQMSHAMFDTSNAVYEATDNEELRQLADFNATFFAIALNLLDDTREELSDDMRKLYEAEIGNIMSATDAPSPLLETDVDFGYSLFKPRGHYTRNETLKHYFRAMMWLQTASFCRDDAKGLRRVLFMAEAFNQLTPADQKAGRSVYNALFFLMGEPDNLAVIEVADYLKSIGVESFTQALSDETANRVNQWLVQEFKERNRIAPKLKFSCDDKLNFMPQRYVPDNEVLATIYDENPNSELAYPRGLHVMDAFGIETAGKVIEETYQDAKNWKDYSKEQRAMRQKFTTFDDWESTMYAKWMESLVILQKSEKNYPGFMQTDAWKIKNLNSALASWSELKHDAILYAEQPMAAECGGGGLPNPEIKGYVEPNLAFWKQLKEMLELNKNMLSESGFLTEDLLGTNEQLSDMVDFCILATEKELRGESLTAEENWQIRYMGSSIEYFTLSVLDPMTDFYHWYDVKGADRSVAVVADVFTRNVRGCEKNGILYEATGNANALYVLVNIDGEIYLSRGATLSYYEFVRPLGDRLTDEQWQEMLQTGKAPDIPQWVKPYFMNSKVEVDETNLYSSGC